MNHRHLLERWVDYFGSNKPMRRIRPEDAVQFINDAVPKSEALKDKGLAVDTRNRLIRESKTVCNHAISWGYLKVNPFAYVTPEEGHKEDSEGLATYNTSRV